MGEWVCERVSEKITVFVRVCVRAKAHTRDVLFCLVVQTEREEYTF